jgi:hypothetical protein
MSIFYGTAVQFWQELISRPSGPLAFRFILQPVMASALAIRDGYHDGLTNRTPYLWTIIYEPAKRGSRLREGFRAVLRVILLGIAMDVAYQVIRLHGLRPVQTIVIVFVLCFLPYLIVRGPAARTTRMRERHKNHHQDRPHAA